MHEMRFIIMKGPWATSTVNLTVDAWVSWRTHYDNDALWWEI